MLGCYSFSVYIFIGYSYGLISSYVFIDFLCTFFSPRRKKREIQNHFIILHFLFPNIVNIDGTLDFLLCLTILFSLYTLSLHLSLRLYLKRTSHYDIIEI